MNAHYLVGLDLGQASDYSAWVIAERSERPEDRAAVYQVRHLERVRAEAYPRIVDHTRSLVAGLRERSSWPQVDLVVDYTGCGRPVADMLVEAKINADIRLVTITAGDSETVGDRGERRVPKRNLVGVVQVLLQTERLTISRVLPLAGVLTEELRNFRARISAAGHDSYGAGDDWRENSHDDLVLALALACWKGERDFRHPIEFLPVITGGTMFPMSDRPPWLGGVAIDDDEDELGGMWGIQQ
jgi:hypothetical protein